MLKLSLFLCAFLCVFQPCFAQDWERWEQAYRDADFALVLNEMTPYAEAGDAEAQFRLGNMHFYGRGVPKDVGKAAEWWKLSAERENPKAWLRLAKLYYDGDGVKKDVFEAFELARKAAREGKIADHYLLGDMYEEGAGTYQNYVSAYMWFNISCAKGASLGCLRRDEIAKVLPVGLLTQGQELTVRCLETDYADCRW
ncbi:tetratricopeptide repeat protein [Rhodovulum sp. FJ3]|uniref:tetratricopeptide repeat protein n=1 Tax=Rhodovulum sp. FJ3 TaxID=3079053 RepID=UPI00293DE2FC|nr:tetratricopeptide repeat protein [Rhodovulum sp. FJ3]MDV4166560.1 tetratricopeptide repeat protein [Rhodovulum sp. FJ3]